MGKTTFLTEVMDVICQYNHKGVELFLKKDPITETHRQAWLDNLIASYKCGLWIGAKTLLCFLRAYLLLQAQT